MKLTCKFEKEKISFAGDNSSECVFSVVMAMPGEKGEKGENGANGTDGADGADGQPGASMYDVVIKTQEEFEAMIADSTWLGAKSVAFVGDGGTLQFTINSSLAIPATVTEIAGYSSAILNINISTLESSCLSDNGSGNTLITFKNMSFISYATFDEENDMLGISWFTNLNANFYDCNLNVSSSGGSLGLSNTEVCLDGCVVQMYIGNYGEIMPAEGIIRMSNSKFSFSVEYDNFVSVQPFYGVKQVVNCEFTFTNKIYSSGTYSVAFTESKLISNCYFNGFATAMSSCSFISNCCGEDCGEMADSSCTYVDTQTVAVI